MYNSGGLVLCVVVGSVWTGSGLGLAWPVHTACSSGSIHITYTSCDPLQDIGLSVTPCPPVPGHNLSIRVSALLRHSVDELYLSADVYLAGDFFFHYNEPICLPDFPRFSFCNRHRGELIHFDRSIKFKLHGPTPIRNQVGAHAEMLTQDGHLVSCVNITLTIQKNRIEEKRIEEKRREEKRREEKRREEKRREEKRREEKRREEKRRESAVRKMEL